MFLPWDYYSSIQFIEHSFVVIVHFGPSSRRSHKLYPRNANTTLGTPWYTWSSFSRYGECVMTELQQVRPRPGDSPTRFVSWLWRVCHLAPKAVAVPVIEASVQSDLSEP